MPPRPPDRLWPQYDDVLELAKGINLGRGRIGGFGIVRPRAQHRPCPHAPKRRGKADARRIRAHSTCAGGGSLL